MAKAKPMNVYLEEGKKKVFACAVEWPGWGRSGRDEATALQTLFDYAPRYAPVAKAAGLSFTAPAGPDEFTVVERVKGNATTDFGAPGVVAAVDTHPLTSGELKRFQSLLQACWQALDAAVQKAAGKELRKGPRGGGRELEKILDHVVESDRSYVSALGWKSKKLKDDATMQERLDQVRQDILDGLVAAAAGEIPAHGPRGGVRWPARYFVRRSAWHILDHAWEIEDRIL